MYSLDKIKLNIVKLINRALGEKVIQAPDLVYPPNSGFGDLSLPCFELAKKYKKSAVETAEWLVSKMEFNNVIVSVKAIGPYLNFTLDKSYLAKDVINQILKIKREYGKNKNGRGKRVMIEYSNANTHKEYHVGHLRNICYGDAVNRVLSANGHKVIPVSYINDFGIHVAKTLWAYQEFYKDKKLPKNKGYFLGQIYVRSTKEMENNPLAKEMVGFMMKKIESKKGAEYKLWQKTRKWSIKQFDKIYKELNIKFDCIFYESEFIGKGLDIVSKLYEKRFLIKSEGVILANLEKYNLGVLLFLRSDGTALYPVADIPLAIEKIKKYKLDKSIYVVDVRQSLYFKQLFKVLDLLVHIKDARSFLGSQISKLPEMIHLGYEFVKLPEGMMSSRTGNVITYEDLREQAIKKAVSETKRRHKDWSVKKIEQVAKAIVNGSIKFEMIKVDSDKIIDFDINQALRFDGFTAAYLQYTYARINSIIKKSKVKSQKSKPQLKTQNLTINFDNLIENKEHGLVLKLAKYSNVIIKAGENYDPSEVAKYLFDLAQLFNDYYHSVPVLKAKQEVRNARLALISSVKQIIANGLDLLGIEVVEEM